MISNFKDIFNGMIICFQKFKDARLCMHGKYYWFTISFGEKFKMTTVSSHFMFQRAVKAWMIANCVFLIIYVFEWVIFHHIEWFKNKIHLVRFFFTHPLPMNR
jgi:hypothetical protein